MHQIGFMQGRLCAQVDGMIQAFPWRDWRNEFASAAEIGIRLMEWTLDYDHLYENPLMTTDGQELITSLCKKYQIQVPSLTGDCFMQAPFWKSTGDRKSSLKADFLSICRACSAVGIKMVVVPLVDNGRLDNVTQENELVEFLLAKQKFLADQNIQLVFESDFPPLELARFISRFPNFYFGINYDIGNSAAFGFNPLEEFAAYGHRVYNVHVKDRLLGGTTVPLTMGSAKHELVFAELSNVNYQGNFILQTARALDGNHTKVLEAYRDMTQQWLHVSGFRKNI